VFPEGTHPKILRASQILVDEQLAFPILLGNKTVIEKKINELGLDLKHAEIIDPISYPRRQEYVEEFYLLRQRKGITRLEAEQMMTIPNYFGAMMVRMGNADGLISGLTSHYPDTIRPALQIIQMDQRYHRVAGLYIIITKKGPYFFADTTVNINPTAEELAEIAIMTAETARRFNVEPKVAMLSFSNFGSTENEYSRKVREAVKIVQEKAPGLMVDGEMQADTATVPEIVEAMYPFSRLKGGANVLIFPDLNSANTSYKLMNRIGGADAIGPILMGMRKPMHVLQTGAEVEDIVNMVAVAVAEARAPLR
jgi:malate dehydrogenase (oxaloacetate-decarboxylating)(NADP+)